MALRKIETVGNEVFCANVYRDAEWNEYRVRFYHFEDLIEDADYFTDDKADAISSARASINHMMQNWRARFA